MQQAWNAKRMKRAAMFQRQVGHPSGSGRPHHAAFQPSAAEVDWARRVVDAFAGAPQTGVINLDGRMIDKPHLVQARRILDRF